MSPHFRGAVPGEPHQTPHALNEYERFVVYANPVSRHAAGLGKDLEHLQSMGSTGHMQLTSQETWPEYDRNLEAIGKETRPGDIVVIRGGDGTAGLVLSALHELQRDIPALVLPRGNANDLAHMLYADAFYDNPELILEHETLQDLYPWEVHLQPEEGEEAFRKVWTYFTLGSSALTAYMYNQPDYRHSLWHKVPGGTWVRERLTATHAYLANDRFLIERPGGKPAKLQDRVISSGNRMAKDFKLNVDLFSNETRMIDARNKWAGLLVIRGLLAGKEMGETFTAPLQFRAVGNPVLRTQVMGEDLAFEGGVGITLKRSNESVPVFTALDDKAKQKT